MVADAVQGLRSDTSFEEIWSSTISLAVELDVEEPIAASRTSRRPARLEDGSSSAAASAPVFISAVDEYKVTIYLLVIDNIYDELHERFYNEDYAILGK